MPRFAPRPVLLGIALLSASPAAAQTGPAFDCAKAGSAAEVLICADDRLATLDRRMQQRFEAAVAAAKGLDAGAEAALAELRAVQRGWIKGRDDCWKADDLRACVEDAYLRREGELVAAWMLDAPAGSWAYWTCGGNPANEVATLFFATERPSLRIEYGDGIDVGVLAPSASGSRYEAGFGRFFWEKGGEAMFSWTEGEVLSCVRR